MLRLIILFVPACLFATISAAEERPAPKDRSEMMRQARVTHARAMAASREILEKLPDDLRAFTREHIEAIKTCAVFRDEYPARDLMRVLLVEYHEPGDWTMPGGNPFPELPFTGYPAAWGLYRIGWPAVLEICDDVENPKLRIEAKRMEMYGLVVGKVLRNLSGPLLELRRSRAPKEMQSRYDDLLETQAIRYYRGIPSRPPSGAVPK